MQEWEEKILEKRKARAEGFAEGIKIRLVQQIKKKIEKSKDLIQIADELEEDPDDIKLLYECVKEHLHNTENEIYDFYKNLK